MAIKYTLYLDESGDFDKDLQVHWKNECLVGGLLVKGNSFTDRQAKSLRETAWNKVYIDKMSSGKKVIKNHATALEGENKAKYSVEILSELKKFSVSSFPDLTFCFFRLYC